MYIDEECPNEPFECSNGNVILLYYSQDKGECVYPPCFTLSSTIDSTNAPTQTPNDEVTTNDCNWSALSILWIFAILCQIILLG